MDNLCLASLLWQQFFVRGMARVLKRIGWIVFVLLLTGFILTGAYRAMRHQEARPPTPHTPPYR